MDDVWSTVSKAGAVPGTTTVHCHRSLLWCQTTKFSVPNCQFQQPPPPIRQSRYFIITSELYTAVELPHNATIYRKSNPPVLHPCMLAPLTLFQSPLPNPVELIFCISVITLGCLRITYSMDYRWNLSMMDCIVYTCGKYVFHYGTTTKWKTFHPCTSLSQLADIHSR